MSYYPYKALIRKLCMETEQQRAAPGEEAGLEFLIILEQTE